VLDKKGQLGFARQQGQLEQEGIHRVERTGVGAKASHQVRKGEEKSHKRCNTFERKRRKGGGIGRRECNGF